jgi:RecJ-like exonuclease
MNNHDNGYAKAQQDYDRQMPKEEGMIVCNDCKGTGVIEHDEEGNPVVCDKCDGTGEVSELVERAEMEEEYWERKMDEERDERRERWDDNER